MHQKSVLHVHILNSLRAILRKETLPEVILILHSVEYTALDHMRVLHIEQLRLQQRLIHPLIFSQLFILNRRGHYRYAPRPQILVVADSLPTQHMLLYLRVRLPGNRMKVVVHAQRTAGSLCFTGVRINFLLHIKVLLVVKVFSSAGNHPITFEVRFLLTVQAGVSSESGQRFAPNAQIYDWWLDMFSLVLLFVLTLHLLVFLLHVYRSGH